ncbi:cobalt ion transmembrane transporter [Artemisia annua]|uniref:Cobalt ion transmembrane transporter n=1 Tax=Artemisia annua TaxID=35608 RepID=A0A2U1KSN4_ARTAN|nr:cobalt ion transmembrane transporter [Artemisia annua]
MNITTLSQTHPNTLIFLHHQNPNTPKFTHSSLHFPHHKKTHFKTTLIKCCNSENKEPQKWEKMIPKNVISAEKILRSIAGATSGPICQFIAKPETFLHQVDPRIKLAWLLVLVVLPARSHIYMRFGLITFLGILSVWILPRQVWTDQLGRVALLSGVLFLMLGLGADTLPMVVQSRTPPPSMMGLPSIPPSYDGYSYLLFKLGPLQLTRKGLSVASTSACLTFSVFQSASLCLTTTTPEQLAFGLQWFMKPFKYIGVPVDEVILTLLLSLRFINLVFDEVRIVALGIVSRRINWQQLATMETVEVFFTYIRRIFKNIFNHAEQITQAMTVRGFRGDSSSHKIYFSSASSAPIANIVSVMTLVGLIGAAALSEYILV